MVMANMGGSEGLISWGNPKANVSCSPILKAIDYDSITNRKYSKNQQH